MSSGRVGINGVKIRVESTCQGAVRLGWTLSRLGTRKPQLGALQGWGAFGGLEGPEGRNTGCFRKSRCRVPGKLAANAGKQNAVKWSKVSPFAPMVSQFSAP